MTTYLNVDVQATLIGRLLTPQILAPSLVAIPLVAFTPPPPGAGVKYLDVRPVLRADPEHFGLDYANSAIHRGIFQVDAVIPDGQGEAPGLRLAALVAERFPIGTTLAVLGRNLVLGQPQIAAAVKDAPWVRFPVSIPFQLIT